MGNKSNTIISENFELESAKIKYSLYDLYREKQVMEELNKEIYEDELRRVNK